MSFYVNGTELKDVYFNGHLVSEVYYNDTFIWNSAYWPGWDNATWEDIYILCKAKQTGRIKRWPVDVVLGATKTVSLSGYVDSRTSYDMRLIGIDIDGEGVLTFHSITVGGSIRAYDSGDGVVDIISDELLTNFYNYCGIQNYIKTLNKGFTPLRGSDKSVYYEDVNIWIPSAAELGLGSISGNLEYTNGVSIPYPYYDSNEKRVKSKAYWTRSYSTRTAFSIYFIEEDGTASTSYDADREAYFTAAFAIG